jgi:Predicted Rossmann fold nucleotide-binding protein involved in DNA uptake
MVHMADAAISRRFESLSATVAQASLSNDEWAAAAPPLLAYNTTAGPEPVRVVSLGDADYPARLRAIEFPPEHLYIIGHLVESTHAPIAIVGSRAPSDQGGAAAYAVAAALAQRGHSIVSGLASGIDAAAHRGALSAHGHTIAVVGTGADLVYPVENRELRNSITRHGAIVSQFPLGHGPSKTTFPARNAVIAGLSAASLLIELSERSGTRIEAELTLEQAKPVLLWAPLLGRAPWAQKFAEHPLVQFVESVDDVTAVLDCCDR